MSERPWYLASTPGIHTDELCDVCGEINIQWLIENKLPDRPFRQYMPGQARDEVVSEARADLGAFHNIPELSLGLLSNIFEKRLRCTFCRLIVQTICAVSEIDLESLPGAEIGNCPTQQIYCTLRNQKKVEAEIAEEEVFEILVQLRDFRYVRSSFVPGAQFAIQRLSETRKAYEGVRVSQLIDLQSMKEWIEAFDRDTTPSCSAPDVSGFRVIDLQQRCVVLISGPGNCRYVALSYVWGGPQKFQNIKSIADWLAQPGSLLVSAEEQTLPKTIADAMFFTLAVGERYLWVDSLCIVQDDAAKLAQINAMDRIYNGALVTLVAAYGLNANAGLPGVREETGRWTQYTAHVRGVLLANRQALIPGLGPSVYYRRGWTYQEEMLSRRLITFGRDGVHFQSEDGVATEDIHRPIHDPTNMRTTKGVYGISLLNVMTPHSPSLFSNFGHYALSVVFYSGKSFTFQRDALIAFTGVLNSMQKVFRRPFLEGLPSAELENALLWIPTSHLTRRRDEATNGKLFATWSWVGWKGTVLYNPDMYGQPPLRFSRITWVDARDGRLFTTDDFRGVDSSLYENISDGYGWYKQGRRGRNAPVYKENNGDETLFVHPVSRIDVASYSHMLESTILKFHAWTVRINGSMETELPGSSSPGLDSWILYDNLKSPCGEIHTHQEKTGPEAIEDKQLEDKHTSIAFDIVVISRTLHENEFTIPDKAPPQDDGDALAIRGEYQARQEIKSDSSAASYFAMADFTDLQWQSYDVLVVEYEDGMAYRIGVGNCRVEAFWSCQPEYKTINLA